MNSELLETRIPTETTTDPIPLPPTQDELPCDDGVPMETERHRLQMELLIHTLKPWLDKTGEGYVGGNMFVYFSLEQVRNQDFRGPDFFAVLGVPRKERKSWVVWEEGKTPDVVIELLSETTAEHDKTAKKIIYQNQMRVPEYFWFDPFNPDDWAGFELRHGAYQPLSKDPRGRLPSTCLGLALVQWRGTYAGVETVWLRWATVDGELLLTEAETASQHAQEEKQRAEREKLRAEREKLRAEKLVAKLRAMGVDPDEQP